MSRRRTEEPPINPSATPREDVLSPQWTLVQRRPEVVRRLLERGITASTLVTLFPDFADEIEAAEGSRDEAPAEA